MNNLKKILLGLLGIFILLQFFRPEKNTGEPITDTDIRYAIDVPENIQKILVDKCYDCHSNNTIYPWYSNIQPVAWWMDDHIREGKEELNFSDFKNYTEKKANHKLEEVSEMIKDDEMPLPSYTLIHRGAKLTDEEKTSINGWIQSMGLKVTE